VLRNLRRSRLNLKDDSVIGFCGLQDRHEAYSNDSLYLCKDVSALLGSDSRGAKKGQ
jgi:hypothetical protein